MTSREDVRQYHLGDKYTQEPWDYVDRPCMVGRAVRAVEYTLARLDRDREEYHILEWGHGGTTAYFSRLLNDSVKRWSWTALDWHKLRAKAVAEKAGLDPRVGVIWREDYVGFPAQLGKRYDLVLITGRDRGKCLEQIPNITAEGGIVLLYDPRSTLHNAAARYCKGSHILGSLLWSGIYEP